MLEENLWTFVCPNCGATDRVAQQVVDADKAAGWLTEASVFGNSHLTTVKVQDPKKKYTPGDKMSVLICLHDYCVKCGTNYCFRIIRQEVKLSLDMSRFLKVPRPGENLPPDLPKDILRGGN